MRKKPVLTGSHLFKLAKVDTFKSWDVELVYDCFYLSNLDKLYTKMIISMSWLTKLALLSLYNEAYVCNKHLNMWHF